MCSRSPSRPIAKIISRYNLKRRITSLPPISSNIFNEKILQAQANSTSAATKAAFEKTCAPCERTYSSENAFRNHLGSQKHKSKVALIKNNEVETFSVISSTFSLGEPVNYVGNVELTDGETNRLNKALEFLDIEDQMILSRRSSQTQEDVPLADDRANIYTTPPFSNHVKNKEKDLNRCLFCNLESQSLVQNVTHMQKLHGMFVPERQYLVDLEGLINHFYEKINDDHQCLYCGKLKQSIFGLQTHMRDKGHCKIPFFTEEEQLEIGEYYDFTSTYSDDINITDLVNSVPRSKNKIMETDEGWETDETESTVDSTHFKQLTSSRGAIENQINDKKTPKTHVNPDQAVDPDDRDHDFEDENDYTGFISDFELHLPSGRIAGHRSMNKYFKQNLHHYPSLAEREENLLIKALGDSRNEERGRDINCQHDKLNSRLSANKFNRELGMLGVTEEKKKEVAALEKRYRKVEERGRRRSEWIINKQNNSQKHFRDPLLQ
ncbi:Cytoplasmic 60S subunit biogenesis factor REI1-like protein [Erysiphe neolycopersici]|uniref:Cytoplasmic 60S subunit biogenesis factor REI1-like protein n=1 Tax=Erysiphe neolycopersici TaxID=212602 RepID=A0A420HWB6_9PEZI|nr:Cytoplasmic 60S subunit biogenesis factor REI1-like protein [Erysiphe neolycopersici]